MGRAEDWQERVGKLLEERFLVLNPRRNPEGWKEGVDIQNKDDANFREQVEWELECQEQANAILMYLIPGTMSPISLLELGEFHPTVVVCPTGFWRKGNVDLVCERYGIKQAESLDAAVDYFMKEWEF